MDLYYVAMTGLMVFTLVIGGVCLFFERRERKENEKLMAADE